MSEPNNEIYRRSPWVVSDFSSWQHVVDELQLEPRALKKATVLYDQGESPGTVFLIESGRVKLSVTSEKGNEKCIFVLGAGCVLGDIALLGGDITRTSAITASSVVLYEIPGKDLMERLETDLALNQAIIRSLLKKINLLTGQMELTCLHDSSYRVIENIYHMIGQFGKQDESGGILIETKITHQEMANLVGATRVTVNNIFLKMEREGLIEKRKNRLYVKDIKRLEEQIREASILT